ncbi:MAG: BON domain-containing protein [Vicinamibacteria bacterium]|nr:BON domain-containing protein [Vicinamibacteria bacterium]
MGWRRKATVTPLGAMVRSWGQGGHPVQGSDHTWLTSKVKLAVMTMEGGGRQAVKAHVQQGKVTLTGTVESRDRKDSAEAAVHAVAGVIEVHNLLRVGRPPLPPAVRAVGGNLKRDVEKALASDQELRDVKVHSVAKGCVALAGSTTDLAFELRAVEAAYAVPGVVQVTSTIATR